MVPGAVVHRKLHPVGAAAAVAFENIGDKEFLHVRIADTGRPVAKLLVGSVVPFAPDEGEILRMAFSVFFGVDDEPEGVP